jgi:hypothetical protein
MTSSNPRPRRYGLRFGLLAAAIVVAIGGYTFAWRYGAERLVADAEASVSALNRDGRRANCEATEATGYPFRIGINCRRVMYEDARAGIGVRAQGFRSAAQIYDWSRLVAELDGPAIVQFPGVDALELNWRLLQGSVKLAEPLPERVSLVAEDLAVALDSRRTDDLNLFTAGRAEIHTRPNGADLDLAIRLVDLEPSVQAAGAVPMQAVADIVFEGVAASVAAGQVPQGGRGTLRSLDVGYGEEAGLTLTGPFEVAEDGLLDAEFELRVRNASRLGELLAQGFPESGAQIGAALSGVAMMGDAASLPLTVRRGEASVGFINLGRVPPLF